MAASAAARRDDGGDYRALLHLAATSDVIRQEVRTRNAASARERKALITRRAALNHESAAERQKYESRITAVRVVIAEAEERLRDAITSAVSVQQIHDVSRVDNDRQRDLLDHELRDTAPEAIAEFVTWTRDELDEVRRQPILETGRELSEERSSETGRRIYVVHTNAPALAARADALFQASRAAQAMAIEVACPTEIEKRLGELRRGIP